MKIAIFSNVKGDLGALKAFILETKKEATDSLVYSCDLLSLEKNQEDVFN